MSLRKAGGNLIALSLKHAGFGITDEAYMQLVYNTIQKNKWYIYKICRGDTVKMNEVSSRVLVHVITHRDYNADKVELDAYVNVLAKHYLANMCAEQNKQSEYDDGYQNSLELSTALIPTVAGCDSEGKYAIEDLLTHYYFKYPEDVKRYCFTTLRTLGIKMYTAESVDCDAPPSDKKSWNVLLTQIHHYDAVTVLNATLTIANRISAQEHRMQRRTGAFAIPARSIDYDLFESLVASIKAVARVGTKDRTLTFDPYTLSMRDEKRRAVNLDTVKWQPLQPNVPTIYACDVSGFLDFLYEQVCVPEGIDTKFIRWLGKRNIKTLPSGTQLEDVSVEQYMLEAKTELLSTLVATKVSNIVGVTEETVYYSPRKRITYSELRYVMFNGASVTLPVQATVIGV